ncbi:MULTISPECIES: hypothetical protein [unclassified Mesorhizobium]|uniref:hypothetical protein n=1 Tax=unclassified Mesorhizobium TaxID=325217 RepID=UPI00333DC7F8
MGYIEHMKIASAQLRLLFSVVLLIAGGALAGLAGQAFGASATADVATPSITSGNAIRDVRPQAGTIIARHVMAA